MTAVRRALDTSVTGRAAAIRDWALIGVGIGCMFLAGTGLLVPRWTLPLLGIGAAALLLTVWLAHEREAHLRTNRLDHAYRMQTDRVVELLEELRDLASAAVADDHDSGAAVSRHPAVQHPAVQHPAVQHEPGVLSVVGLPRYSGDTAGRAPGGVSDSGRHARRADTPTPPPVHHGDTAPLGAPPEPGDLFR